MYNCGCVALSNGPNREVLWIIPIFVVIFKLSKVNQFIKIGQSNISIRDIMLSINKNIVQKHLVTRAMLFS